ncbi:MAG TPA: CRISPR-associated helicase Cas3' [Candidatus Marinimicrobia bacterium]|nr:CRISPR-associated helicase Cas3' [Candidatus Neomarinimicrobiota bacterium]
MMLSHYPKKELSRHIEEVEIGFEFITSFHSRKTMLNLQSNLMKDIIRFHDEGKKSRFFQEYIIQPDKYNGDPALKAHSKLSALITSVKYQDSPIQLFQILQCIGGHHSQLLTLVDMMNYWLTGENYLIKQLSSFFSVPKYIDLQHPSDRISDLLEDQIVEILDNQSLETVICYRIMTQFMFSLLLEADKILLVADIHKHIAYKRHDWKLEWIEKKIGKPPRKKINILRDQIRKEIQNINCGKSIFTLTSPTGSGKTLLSATWALKQRDDIYNKTSVFPKIIIVLPFLSIIDQTVDEYKNILKIGEINYDGSWLIASHSLSDRKFSDFLEEKEEGFFIDTWRSDLIITTYDQFLYTIFNPKAKYQMRFHNLLDSVIIIDEVQSLPTKLWKPLEEVLCAITRLSESRILLMSATLPSFISQSVPLMRNYRHYFSSLNRYTIDFSDIRNDVVMKIDDFSVYIISQITHWVINEDRVLITLNTRASAQKIFMDIQKYISEENLKCSVFFISADVVPIDRLERINKIKKFFIKKEPCIVVSTQCVEAGVDIDMTVVIRDFAPLDSIIQIAGRCNRNGSRGNCPVKIVQIRSKNGKLFSEMIYNDIHLQKTRNVVKTYGCVFEKNILGLTEKYFEELMGSDGVSQGKNICESFAYFREFLPIRELLRGKEIEKYEFVILERDQSLKEEIFNISEISDKWIRREKWRRLSGRISNLTVSVIAKSGFCPEEVADQYFGLWSLNMDYYSEDIGFYLPESDNSCLIV